MSKEFDKHVAHMNEAFAIVRELATRPPDFYEEWLESIKGPGRWCPLCRCITKEGGAHSMQQPMPLEHHNQKCPYARAVEWNSDDAA